MPRLTKIYTRKGDDGFTTFGEKRLPKDDLTIETIGSLDELNSSIGVVLSQPIGNETIKQTLRQTQNDLFDIGGELFFPSNPVITSAHIERLEHLLDEFNATLKPLEEFMLPGGPPAAAFCQLARTICRRAERMMVKLHAQTQLSNIQLLRYLNRLSDLLFVIARVLLHEENETEILWKHKKKGF